MTAGKVSNILSQKLLALLLVAVCCSGNGPSAIAGPIRLVSTKTVNDKGQPFTLVNISTGQDATQSDNPNGVSFWIRRPSVSFGIPFIRNNAGTVAALNVRPATHWEMVYLLLSSKDGKITMLSNFNERLAALCNRSGKVVNRREIYAERIDGNVVSLVSRDDEIVHYDLKVKVSPNGGLRLLHYRRTNQNTSLIPDRDAIQTAMFRFLIKEKNSIGYEGFPYFLALGPSNRLTNPSRLVFRAVGGRAKQVKRYSELRRFARNWQKTATPSSPKVGTLLQIVSVRQTGPSEADVVAAYRSYLIGHGDYGGAEKSLFHLIYEGRQWIVKTRHIIVSAG